VQPALRTHDLGRLLDKKARLSSQYQDPLAIARRLPEPEVEIDGQDSARYRMGSASRASPSGI
jgi:hypothetical protein